MADERVAAPSGKCGDKEDDEEAGEDMLGFVDSPPLVLPLHRRDLRLNRAFLLNRVG